MTWDRKIPFDKDGNQVAYCQRSSSHVEWRDAKEFEAVLSYDCYGRGRSAAYLVFRNHLGHQYHVFMRDAHDIIPHCLRGTISGVFVGCKRGTNYGLKLVRLTEH